MSMFQSPSRLGSTNGGAISFTVVEQPPDQGAVSNARPGVTGLAVGDTIFTLRTDPRYIVFSECYMRIQGHFLNAAGTAPLTNLAANSQICACDNWPSALFQTCRVTLNGSQIEQSLFVPQTDTAATYSAATHSWLKSYGTASGVGESLTNRLKSAAGGPYNTAVPTAAGKIVATFRPPLSIFNCPTAIRGNQWRIIMSWNPSGEQNMVESAGLQSSTVGSLQALPVAAISGSSGSYTFVIDSFTMFVATAQPDPNVPLPRRVLIDLTPCQTILVSITGTSTIQTNVSIPPTTFRLSFAFQDANTNINTGQFLTGGWTNGHGTNGIYPITNFALGFSVGTTTQQSTLFGSPSWLSSFRWTSSQLGLSWPIPDYQFAQITGTAPAAVANTRLVLVESKAGLERAYRDFIQTTQGDKSLCEGAIPFGNLDSGVPINEFGTISVTSTLALTSSALNYDYNADPENPNAITYVDPNLTSGVFSATVTNLCNTQMATYGWLGRYPILSSPVVKPVGTNLSQVDVYTTFSGSGPTSASMYVFAYYGAAVAIEYAPDGTVSKVEIQQNN